MQIRNEDYKIDCSVDGCFWLVVAFFAIVIAAIIGIRCLTKCRPAETDQTPIDTVSLNAEFVDIWGKTVQNNEDYANQK